MKNSGMTRRQFLSYTAAVTGAAAIGQLTGCAPATSEPTKVPATPIPTPRVAQPVTIKFWYWFDTPEYGQFFRDMVDGFNKRQQTIIVEGEVMPSIADARQKMVLTAASGAGGPDVSIGSVSLAFEFHRAGITVSPQKYFDQWPGKVDMIPKILENDKWVADDKPLTYMPWGTVVALHYYRSDLYQAAGLKAPDTFEELVKSSRALTKAPDRYGFGLRLGDGNGARLNVLNYLTGEGVTYSDGKGGSTLDSPAAVAMLNSLVQLYDEKICQPSALQDVSAQMFGLFQTGKIANMSAQLNHVGALSGTKREFESTLGVCMFPAGKAGRFVESRSGGFHILKASKNPEAAWEFIAWMLEPDNLERHCKTQYSIPARKSVADRSFFQQDRYMKMALDSSPYYFSYPNWHKNWSAIEATQGFRLFQQVFQKEVTAQAALKQLADLLRET